MVKPAPIDPKEFSAKADLVHKAQARLGRARVELQKANKELDSANAGWMEAWSKFNRYAQEAAGIQYEPDRDGDNQKFPVAPDRWEAKNLGKP